MTYVIEDNKIVMDNGEILTIMEDGTLLVGGSTIVLSRWENEE